MLIFIQCLFDHLFKELELIAIRANCLVIFQEVILPRDI